MGFFDDIGDAANNLGNAASNAYNAVVPKFRDLKGTEDMFMTNVFGNSILEGNVQISDKIGFGGAPWTSPGVGPNQFIMHVGPVNFDLNLAQERKSLLVHELTHVWQGLHDFLPIGYMVNSMCHQSLSLMTSGHRHGAYSIDEEDLQWNQYNSEQQGELVEGWVAQGDRSAIDWRYRYITANILAGNPNAISTKVQPPTLFLSMQMNANSQPKFRLPKAVPSGRGPNR